MKQTTLFKQEPKFPRTQYLGSKERLTKWIYENSPKDVTSFFDAFSGTSVVAFYFKKKGKRTITNDFLQFNFYIGKALIENSNILLEERDIETLFRSDTKHGTLIENIFVDVFFEQDEARFLDQFRANVDLLEDEYKKSLALSVMCRALTRKVLLGHFAHLSALRYSKDPLRVKRNPSIAKPLKKLFMDLLDDYNQSVFDNGQKNKAYCGDTIDLVKKIDVDLVYFDPPYFGCHPDYQSFYHFLETFVQYWQDKEFINGTKQYFPKKDSGFVQKDEVVESFKKLFENSVHIRYWLISYNSKSYPDKETMVTLIKEFRRVKVFEYEYQNHYGGKGSRKGTKEYLFYCY